MFSLVHQKAVENNIIGPQKLPQQILFHCCDLEPATFSVAERKAVEICTRAYLIETDISASSAYQMILIIPFDLVLHW